MDHLKATIHSDSKQPAITNSQLIVWNNRQKHVRDRAYYRKWIDNLLCKAKIKNCLKWLNHKTHVVGNRIYEIGKFIINSLIKLSKHFPATVGGAVIGFFLSLVISTIPFVGWLIGPFLMPILVTLGGICGFASDIRSNCGQQAVVKVETSAKNSL
jgi:hypothetical protein